jgi:hypothetical protein
MRSGMFNENNVKFGAQDIRFTAKDGKLYAWFLGWPADGKLVRMSAPSNCSDRGRKSPGRRTPTACK